MKNHIAVILYLLTTSIVSAQVKNVEAKGNLESTASITAMKLTGIDNKNTPADIFRLVAKNIKDEQYEEAAKQYVVGIAYGAYDKRRVADTTAHQAITVLKMNNFGDIAPLQMEKFQSAVNELLKNHEAVAATLRELGKPDYNPRYMIQHGMGAFLGNTTKNGLVAHFDSDQTWEEIISEVSK